MMDLHQSRRLDERRLWSGYVQQLFQTLDLGDRATAQEVGESVAVFCQQHANVSAHALSLLMARSFCVTGDAEAAGRILYHDRESRPHAGSWLEVLSAGHPFPELYPLFSARALRPQSLSSAGTLWVLDYDKVQLSEADRHELILLQTVRVLTEKISSVWKKSGGQGTLGVKGLPRLMRFVRGRRGAPQLPRHIEAVLALCARKNGWRHTPAVLFLDL